MFRSPGSRQFSRWTLSADPKRALLSHIACLLLSLLLLLQVSSPVMADALCEHSQYTDNLVQGKTWLSAAPFVQEMYGAIQQYVDYVLDSSVTVRKNDALKEDRGRLYFKKEQRIRVECKSGRINKGAVVVQRNDGKVRAAGGGALKCMKMNLENDSRMLMLANGYNVLKCDLKSLMQDLKGRLTSESKVTSEVVAGERWESPVKIVEVRNGDTITDRIFVGQSNHVPLEWDLYKSGQLFSITRFQNFQANVGLKDELFEL